MTAAAEPNFDQRVAAIRRFNRFYTRQIGALQEHLLHSPFSLTEARVIYELAHHEQITATELREELRLDAGYLSRLLRSFHKRRLTSKSRSKTDGRQMLLSLTEKGQEAFAQLNARSHDEIGAMLAKLPPAERDQLVQAMHTIETVLGAPPEHKVPVPYILRPHQAGDMGWVVQRHGVLYAQEYGWNEQFEALVAEIVAKFIQHFDPRRERCWIAEKDGENVGSVFLVRRSRTLAQLRLLLVEPQARGLSIGTRLVDECIRFARHVGYRKIMLWTNDVLHVARRIYERSGFRLVREEPHHSFGQDLVGQTWELDL
ncbi:MAG TPA: helix-turn-helix domain-containing GNAT family N-acetyltransferase [Gemmatimonadales bacterium]|nr:helix-turn-helix domain-containing GNAT family N-acetyltransferase [Gemmatimonadales bacterium]